MIATHAVKAGKIWWISACTEGIRKVVGRHERKGAYEGERKGVRRFSSEGAGDIFVRRFHIQVADSLVRGVCG